MYKSESIYTTKWIQNASPNTAAVLNQTTYVVMVLK